MSLPNAQTAGYCAPGVVWASTVAGGVKCSCADLDHGQAPLFRGVTIVLTGRRVYDFNSSKRSRTRILALSPKSPCCRFKSSIFPCALRLDSAFDERLPNPNPNPTTIASDPTVHLCTLHQGLFSPACAVVRIIFKSLAVLRNMRFVSMVCCTDRLRVKAGGNPTERGV